MVLAKFTTAVAVVNQSWTYATTYSVSSVVLKSRCYPSFHLVVDVR